MYVGEGGGAWGRGARGIRSGVSTDLSVVPEMLMQVDRARPYHLIITRSP